ncbi:flavin reductase [Akkermansia sp. N21116]|jgi:flavin reductase (DIM6/NTAB) family NADH-FMN oxidoreductase RutF|uniref:flavin reductase family protein n=1 Tax=Akkermansia sp. N21116 TaxID=3040764 RepID=UPI00244E94FB|nr:flavin reductase [Akkermansia sp. N21116]WPX41601.1 flavin reductase [Akkermansia sp. N21116]
MMKEISPVNITDNAVELIGHKWMLITAGDRESFNLMTASWGGIGFMWGKPVAFVVVRPNRYTYEFIEKKEYLTLSFMGEEFRSALRVCGTTSGRNGDKMAAAGLSPIVTEMGNVAVEGADLVLECRKLYSDALKESGFVDKSCLEKWYAEDNPLHRMYVVEIMHAWIKE